MSHWNYRVLTCFEQGVRVFKVTEVYYDEGAPTAWVEDNGGILCWDNYEDLKGTAERVTEAFKKPILCVGPDDKLVEWERE